MNVIITEKTKEDNNNKCQLLLISDFYHQKNHGICHTRSEENKKNKTKMTMVDTISILLLAIMSIYGDEEKTIIIHEKHGTIEK